ncbi:MAG: RICIN domain-containing protein [Bacteriovoracaceae bacterium]
MKNVIFILLFIWSCSQSHDGRSPASNVNFTNGMVPMEYGARPATDLYYKGEPLLPEEAHQMVLDSEGKFDLSLLNPDPNTVLWKDVKPQELTEKEDELEINDDDEVKYLDVVRSRSGRFRFSVRVTKKNGEKRTYRVMLSKQIHNLLLRKNLLRKLGYKVPKIKYYPKLKINFSSYFAKENFFNDVSQATFGDPARWVIDYEKHLREDEILPQEERNILDSQIEDEDFKNLPKHSIQNVSNKKCLSRDINNDRKGIYQYDCKREHFYAQNWVFQKQDDSTYLIKSAQTGKCLDIKRASKITGADAIEYKCNGGTNQKFIIEDGAIENGTPTTIKAVHSGYCLRLKPLHSRKKNRIQVEQSRCHDKSTQKWTINPSISGDGPLREKEEISLQDVIVLEEQDHYYNLAYGFLPPEVIQGRRLLNSLFIPYALVETPESINLLNWHIGRIINGSLKLEMESSDNFNPTYYDAKWITRRILKLTRSDWAQIVKMAYFPPEVEALLTEKLISRRNHLMQLFHIDNLNMRVQSQQQSQQAILLNPQTGKCLGLNEKNKLAMITCESDVEKKSLLQLRARSENVFSIVLDSNQNCLDINKNSRLSGANLIHYPCHGKDNQLFEIIKDEKGLVDLKSVRSGKCIGPDKERIEQHKCGKDKSQKWELLNFDRRGDYFFNHSLKINPDISMGEKLKKGKLQIENWPGYASRFSFGDPENPLSGKEIGHFVLSKAASLGLSAAIAQVNQRFLNNTDYLTTARDAFMKELQIQTFIKYLITGVPQNVPLGVWAYPTINGNIIVNRDVVIGSYLATDNQVQLADTIGFNVNLGVYAELYGLSALLPTPIPVGVNARAQVGFTRTFSHLRPIKSFKAANKYPVKNLIIPYLTIKQGKIFDDLLHANLKDLEDEERKKLITKVIGEFKKQLPVGDSFIISDNINLGGNLTGGLQLQKLVSLGASVGGNNLTIARLHINRADEDTIHVYRDLGNVTSLLMSIQFKALVPILSLSSQFSAGVARTKFWSININEDEEKNSKLIENITGLRSVLVWNSLRTLKKAKKPLKVKHYFKESLNKARFTALSGSKLRGRTRIELTHAKGYKKELYQTTQAVRKGYNIEQYTVDALNNILSEYTEWDVQLSSINKGAPGDSLGGGQHIFKVSYEGELKDRQRRLMVKKGLIESPFVMVSESYRGFVISKKRAEGLLQKINERYQKDFYPEEILNQTKRIFLYNIGVDVQIYKDGINFLSGLDKKTFSEIIKKHTRAGAPWLKRKALEFSFWKYLKHFQKNNYTLYSKWMRHTLSQAVRWLDVDGLKKILGGEANFLIISRVNGYRIGDEAADQAIISNSIGQFGDDAIMGPIRKIISELGINESEFMAYWIRGRLN